jgi:hypothetical protein
MIERMEPRCVVPDCQRKLYARGYCNAHYIAARKHPDETPAQLAQRSRRTRTEAEVLTDIRGRLDTTGDCWTWTGATDQRGYGNLRWAGRLWGVHRLMFHLAVRPVERGEEVCHRCDNPICCNPAHLFVGTHHDNMLDAAAKGRMAGNGGRSGERNGRARLRAEDVRAIRASREPGRVLAERYGIHVQTVSGIRTGRLRASD